MSQFCKTSGGKRVDHSKAGSIERRAKIAALAFQSPAQQWITNVNKFITEKISVTYNNDLEECTEVSGHQTDGEKKSHSGYHLHHSRRFNAEDYLQVLLL
ncbi:hypothetical protein TNIN_218461 [Trichonephila inaurata madagascariensis]|uniref:Uncharacterized protein n=1 Tax=Trichonephila inaurata madagascariensis TaxID=2747483 RepID=A0A8X6YWW1_9ARAC|nr:hypothetical protein TNIN_218461 [Trichonephila inaurata madagascariensis]